MALTPQNSDAFLREVDEEVRRDQVAAMTRRYGILVGGLILLALIGLGAVLFWRAHAETVAGERGERFTAAMSTLTAGDGVGATKQIDPLIKDAARGYAPLARILKADMLVQQRKDKDAAAAFLAIAHDDAAPQPLRDLATIRSTALGFDDLAPQAVIDRLKPLTVRGNPWFGSAGEMTGIARMKLNQTKQAGALFASVAKDQTVPQTIRQRVAQLAADLGVEVVQPADSAQP